MPSLGSVYSRQGGGVLGCICSQASGDHMVLAEQLLSCSPLIREGKSCLKPQTQDQRLHSSTSGKNENSCEDGKMQGTGESVLACQRPADTELFTLSFLCLPSF